MKIQTVAECQGLRAEIRYGDPSGNYQVLRGIRLFLIKIHILPWETSLVRINITGVHLKKLLILPERQAKMLINPHRFSIIIKLSVITMCIMTQVMEYSIIPFSQSTTHYPVSLKKQVTLQSFFKRIRQAHKSQ